LARHFCPVSIHDVLDWHEGRSPLPRHAVLVTFDDGYRNNLTLAADVLERHGVPAVIHVSTGYIGQQRVLWTQEVNELVLRWPGKTIPLVGEGANADVPAAELQRQQLANHVRGLCKRLSDGERREYLDRLRSAQTIDFASEHAELFEFLSWDEVRSLSRRGFAIGSHTVEHPILTRLSQSELAHELVDSKRRIETETGAECRWIAYPNGGPNDFSSAVLVAAKRAGYRLGFTLTENYNGPVPDALAITRISIPGHLPRAVFESRTSGFYALLNQAV